MADDTTKKDMQEECACEGEGASAHKGAEGQGETASHDEKCACHPPLPKATFTTFVLSLASSALVQLGEVPEPETGTMQEELEHAKYTIDVLSMIHDKVTNGIDDEERRLLDGLLYELRMKYVAKKP